MRPLVCIPLMAVSLLGCGQPAMRQAAELMESPIVPASDAIFGAVIYTNGQLAASPQTPADWDRLGRQAQTLREAAVRLGAFAPMDNPAPWRMQSRALEDASAAALVAAQSKSLQRVLDAGSRIYDTCTACHAVYATEP